MGGMAMEMTMNEVGNKQIVDAQYEQDDQDECDGWGPIRARRSSVPVNLEADASTKQCADKKLDEQAKLKT
jgi:hypothetical protein